MTSLQNSFHLRNKLPNSASQLISNNFPLGVEYDVIQRKTVEEPFVDMALADRSTDYTNATFIMNTLDGPSGAVVKDTTIDPNGDIGLELPICEKAQYDEIEKLCASGPISDVLVRLDRGRLQLSM